MTELKMTSGYASFDYEILEHREGDLVKLGILVNSEPVDALAMMIHKDFAQKTGREVCDLQERQLKVLRKMF